ncbi:MAG: hypothetical protein M1418_05320, partial [Deltaproteobacteria bacterium]|nr:hypothetical protein [Deltaproteobacteria bacterium]
TSPPSGPVFLAALPVDRRPGNKSSSGRILLIIISFLFIQAIKAAHTDDPIDPAEPLYGGHLTVFPGTLF